MTASPYCRPNDRTTMLRFRKKQSGVLGLPELMLNSDFPAELIRDSKMTYETPGEYVVSFKHLILKDACVATLRMVLPENVEIIEVLLEGRRLPYVQAERIFNVDVEISGLQGGSRTLNVHTLIREPGLVLRVEHNDINRVAGKYSDLKYPCKQISAALHYEFATRELLLDTGLPGYLNDNDLGYLLILGFETCSPIHTDYPPHWHLIFRWPYFVGSQASHIYIDDEGRNISNILYVDGISGVSKTYAADEWCKYVDMYGGDLCAFSIDPTGGYRHVKPNGDEYQVSAFKEDHGVQLSRNGNPLGTVHVQDDIEHSRIRVLFKGRNGYEKHETFQYDSSTGLLIGSVVEYPDA